MFVCSDDDLDLVIQSDLAIENHRMQALNYSTH